MRLSYPVNALYVIGLTLMFSFCLAPKVSAFDKPDVLNLQIRGIVIKGESIAQVLDRLSNDYEIPVGIELGNEKLTPRREINLDLPETTLKEVLDAVVAKDARYTWKLEGGVIHVWPVSGRDAFLATLLDTKISHFAIVGEVNTYAIYTDIMDLSEVKSKLVSAGVDPLTFRGPGSGVKLGKATFFTETNLTLRELLDKIVTKTDIRQWVISRWGKNSEFISLSS